MIEDWAKDWAEKVAAICRKAGEAILEIYGSDDIDLSTKADDSPLTAADMASHEIILAGLSLLTPQIPVLSEESDHISYSRRRSWQEYWLVDPLDGTKEFISRNGEFTVNVALIHDGVPRLGVVYLPIKEELYVGVQGERNFATKQVGEEKAQNIRVRALQKRLDQNLPVTVVASRRHGSEELEDCLDKLSRRFDRIETTNMGSSLKICRVAEGKADLYPRLAPTCEWDTAAAQAVVEAAGGELVDTRFRPLRYNRKEDLLNPNFLVIGDSDYDWRTVLA